jgi:hypothetical protein
MESALIQNTSKFGIDTVDFQTAKTLVKRQDVIYLTTNFVDQLLRVNRNFNIDYCETALRAAVTLSDQFGQAQSASSKIDKTTLAQATWFLYWNELSNLIPIRSAIKNSTHLFKDKVVLVPMPKTEINIFTEWQIFADTVQMITYLQLKRLGIDAYLVTPPGQITNEISIIIDKNIINTQILSNDKAIFCPRGMRGANKAVKYAFTECKSSHAVTNFHLSLQKVPEQKIQIKLQRKANTRQNSEFIVYSSSASWSHYEERIQQKILDLLEFVYMDIRRLTEDKSIKEAHICDHLFADNALVAGCIRANGGKVILWPHSNNAGLRWHRNAPPDKINRTLKDSWPIDPIFSSTKFIVRSELTLEKPKRIHSIVKHEKQNIILVAGASKMGQLPILDLLQHEETITSFISGLFEREKNVNFFVRPKGHLANLKYFERLVGRSLREALGGPKEIDLPNMTFISFTYCSSALIEGLGRGIPGLVIAEQPIRDYLDLDREFFPRLAVDDALELIDAFRDLRHYKNYWVKQSAFFKKYASFS